AWLGRRLASVGPGRRGLGPCSPVETELLAKMVQGDRGDAYSPGALDEVENIVARGVGMSQDELGDRAGITWQELAVGPAGHAVVRCLNRFLGGNALLMRGRRPADADQAGDLGHLESALAVEQEMAE